MDTSQLLRGGSCKARNGGWGQQVDLHLVRVVPVGDTQLGYDIWVHGGPWVWTAEAQGVRAGLPNVPWKGPESKHFKFCRPYGLCHSYLPFWCQHEAATDLREPVRVAGLQEHSSSY